MEEGWKGGGERGGQGRGGTRGQVLCGWHPPTHLRGPHELQGQVPADGCIVLPIALPSGRRPGGGRRRPGHRVAVPLQPPAAPHRPKPRKRPPPPRPPPPRAAPAAAGSHRPHAPGPISTLSTPIDTFLPETPLPRSTPFPDEPRPFSKSMVKSAGNDVESRRRLRASRAGSLGETLAARGLL